MYKLSKVQPSFLDKLLKREPYYNFYVEVFNLLIPEDVKEINLDAIDQISSKYPKNVIKKNKENLMKLLKEKLKQFYNDQELTNDEINFIKTYIQIFSLNSDEVKKQQRQIAKTTYSLLLDEFLDDEYLSAKEKEKLKKVSSNLNLSSSDIEEIYSSKVNRLVEKKFNEIIRDERISPEEEKKFIKLCENLGVNPQMTDATMRDYERYKMFWKIENYGLDEIPVYINLQRNEKCYVHLKSVDWYETRKITERVNYAGPSVRIRIMKGVYYKVGSYQVKPVTKEVDTLIDSGELFITSKRIIFMGKKGNKTVPLNKILYIDMYTDGFTLQKDSGKWPTIVVNDENVDIQLLVFIMYYLMQNT